jgi:WD repeat-containing protein 19
LVQSAPCVAVGQACIVLLVVVAAGDLDAVVRLCLDKLSDTGRACTLTRKSRSASAAAQVARHCLAAGDVTLAVEFLLLAGQLDQAFDVAAAKGAMDVFAQLVADNSTVSLWQRSQSVCKFRDGGHII